MRQRPRGDASSGSRQRTRAGLPRGRRRAPPGRAAGTGGKAPAPAGESRACSAPSASRRAISRHPAQSYERADGGTHAHNTLSADHVRVLYPFHPLHGATLQILRRPKREDGAVCVMDPAGRRLKIPVWMLLAEWAEVKIWQQPHLGKHALLSLAALITSQLAFKDRVHDNLLQTRVSGCEEGRRDATSTAGPDDPKGMRCRATGRSDTRQSDRSHGPGSSSGLWRGGGKSE